MAAIDDDVDLMQAIMGLWRAKWLIAGSGLACGLVAAVVTLAMPNIYRTEAVLAPATDPTQSSPKSLAAQVSSLAGLSIGGSTADPTQVTLATLKSKLFLVSFVRRHGLEVPLIAGEGWNQEAQSWAIDPDIYDEQSRKWVRQPEPPRGSEPSDGEIFDVFKEDIDVSFDRATGLVTVSLDSISPLAARDWLSAMISDLNAEMRKRAIAEATSSISYLERQIAQTEVASMKEALFRLVEDQLRNRMLAEVRESFALTMIDPPYLPEEKVSPIRSVICIAAVLLGSLLASLGVLTVNAVRSGSRVTPR
jgi:hypothetical protein